MARTHIPAADLQRFLAEEGDRAFGVVLTVDHPDLVSPERLCANTDAVTIGGDVYNPFWFDVVLPKIDEGDHSPAKLVVDALANDRQLVAHIRSFAEAATVKLGVANFSDETMVFEITPLEWRNVTYNDIALEGELVDAQNDVGEPYPPVLFTPFTAPGVFGVVNRDGS